MKNIEQKLKELKGKKVKAFYHDGGYTEGTLDEVGIGYVVINERIIILHRVRLIDPT